MATFTITVPDAVVSRIQLAFGIESIPETAILITSLLKAYLKERVNQYESAKAGTEKSKLIQQENWS